MNTDTSIPMLHMSAVAARMDMLEELGVPLRPGLLAAKMPSRIVEEREGYVPFKAACTWVEGEARRQGIDNFGLRSALRTGPAMLPESLRATLTASPTLYQGICTWADLVQRESSHTSIWLDDSGEDLRLWFSSTFAQDVPGQSDWIWAASALHMTVARLFLGPTWRPTEMVVPMHGGGLDVARELLPDTRLIMNPKLTGLTLPRELLSTKPIVAMPNRGAARSLPNPPASLEASLTELIRLYLPDGPPRIEAAAEVAGLTVRTLQRHLAAQSVNYEQLVSNQRFEQARQMLDQGEMSIHDISRALGYTHPTHFARAFRRIAGMSPRQYRKKARH